MDKPTRESIGFRLDCRSIEALISRSMDTRLSRRERLAIRLHLVYCRLCRAYRRQLDFLRRALSRSPEQFDAMLRGATMPTGLRERLERTLRRHP
jgi:predicted anti-sigma-YlaC factor YlaD